MAKQGDDRQPELVPVEESDTPRDSGETNAGTTEPSGPIEILAPKPERGRPKWQEFFIPVHGLVRLTPTEVRVVDHPAFQRLGSVYQLGQTHLVYRGATHRRIEHALGALFVAQEMINAVHLNEGPEVPVPEETVEGWTLGAWFNQAEIDFIRLAALLHDVGHLPAGHTLEDEIGLLDGHDGRVRLGLVCDRVDWPGEKVQS